MNKLERQLPFGVEMIAVVISDNKIPYFWPENSCRRSRAQRSWLIFLTFNETNAYAVALTTWNSGAQSLAHARGPRTKISFRRLIIKPSSSLWIQFPGYIFLFVEQKIKKHWNGFCISFIHCHVNISNSISDVDDVNARFFVYLSRQENFYSKTGPVSCCTAFNNKH